MNWNISGNRTTEKRLLKKARQFGYIKDQKGILRRYLREETGWNAHLESCKSFIQEMAGHHKKDRVAVLGSGWLLDVPIGFLAKIFREVYLVDIFHPKYVVHGLKKYTNVFPVMEDLTGGAILEIASNKKSLKQKGTEWLKNLKLKGEFFYHDFDFVISLNIINQLDILIVDFLNTKYNIAKQNLDFLRERIQDNHLRSMPPGKSCMVADVEEIPMDGNDQEMPRKKLIYTSIDNLDIQKEWLWHFDTDQSYNNDCNTHFKVIACRL